MKYIQMKRGYPEKLEKRPKHGAFVLVKLYKKDLEFDHYRLEHKPSCQETFFVADIKIQDGRRG